MSKDSAPASAPASGRSLILAAVVIVVGVLGTWLPETQVMGVIPLKNLLKNALHQDRAAVAAFFFWTTLPWYLKPVVGIVMDAVPLFGTRRRSYLLAGALLSALSWLALAVTPRDYYSFLAVCFLINLAMMTASTAIGGFLVEVAQGSGSSGRLTSVRSFAQYAGYVLGGPLGGALAGAGIIWTAVAGGAITFLVVPVAIWCLREPAAPANPRPHLLAARDRLVAIGRAGPLWVTAAVAMLFYFAPGTQTAQFYAQQNLMHLDTSQQGFLVFLNGVFGVVASVLYGGVLARRWSLRVLLLLSIAAGAAAQAGYAWYDSWTAARLIDSCWGFGYTLAEVAIMHLTVRATPRGSEALGFALMMAVRNFGIFAGDWMGASLMDRLHWSLHALALINGAVSLLALPVALLLPAAVVNVRDARRAGPPDLQPAPQAGRA
ncbi:MAG TPA: MFS transporter [Steroidobacteraceae bacterium]|nr:MFS transporter [Steroidobacteraceae bacterium]